MAQELTDFQNVHPVLLLMSSMQEAGKKRQSLSLYHTKLA